MSAAISFSKYIKALQKQFLTMLACSICLVNSLQAQAVDSAVAKPVNFAPKVVTGRSLIVPGILMAPMFFVRTSPILATNAEGKEERNEMFPHFHTTLDNYLQFAPVAAGYAMLINNRQHSFWGYTEKILLTEVISTGVVQATKRIVKEQRPDGSSFASFPSGHTAQAFAGATIFVDEFAQHKPWLAASAYTFASAVGVLRVLNNKHWAGDVVAGAGFGILSAKLSELMLKAHDRTHHAYKPVVL